MPNITLTFTNDINTSVQVGDIVYHCTTSIIEGFNVSTEGTNTNDNIKEVGAVLEIDNSTNTIMCSTDGAELSMPPSDSFILFSKDNRVNMASPVGYYAQVKFVNDSKVKGEMFAAACEIFGSSK
jgi:hypothetical protein